MQRSLDRVLAGPFPGGGFVSRSVRLVDVSDLRHQRVVGVGVSQHRAYGQKDCSSQVSRTEQHRCKIHRQSRPTFGECESRTPLVSQNIQTDATVGVDVGVVDASGEVDLGGLEWVVGREVNLEEEDTARVRRVGLSSQLLADSSREGVEWHDAWIGSSTAKRILVAIGQAGVTTKRCTYGTHDGSLPAEL